MMEIGGSEFRATEQKILASVHYYTQGLIADFTLTLVSKLTQIAVERSGSTLALSNFVTN